MQKSTLNVLHVYKAYFPDQPGGLQEAIRQITFTTKFHGVSSTIFALSPNPNPKIITFAEGGLVRSRSWLDPASCDIGLIDAFCTFSKLAERADIINYHFPWPFADLLHTVVRPNKPAIMTYHSDIVRQKLLGKIYNPLMQKMLNSMSAVVATSPTYIQTSPVLTDVIEKDRLHMIPLGIDEGTYSLAPDNSIFKRVDLNIQEPYFLFIGVLRYYKGLHSLINAATGVKAKIVIAGSGPEEVNLKKQVDKLDLKNVVFTGQITSAEKSALLENCIAFILPSHLRSEAFGMVLIEASMKSKPLISCEIGTGTTYVNINDQTGIVVRPENEADLSSAMNLLLSDPALVSRYGLAARKRYEEFFSGDVLGKNYARLYNSILS